MLFLYVNTDHINALLEIDEGRVFFSRLDLYSHFVNETLESTNLQRSFAA